VTGGYLDDERLGRRLKRLNARITDACALELACSPGVPGELPGSARDRDGLVLLGVLRTGAVAVVPVAPARTRRERLLSLSDSVAECAMLLGLGTSIYAPIGPDD